MAMQFPSGWGRINLIATIVCAAAMALAIRTGAANAADPPMADLSSTLGELRKGGFVIYFRHASTEPSDVADAAADLTRCETQRALSAKGRAEAAEIGKAVKSLGIPIGTVMASPFCRTRDTAQLAFGRHSVSQELYFVIRTDAAETKRLADSLRRMLSKYPGNGTNTVLVGHSANLFEAAGIFAKPEGVAFVFRPLADGRFEPVARILPEEWTKVATLKRSMGSF